MSALKIIELRSENLLHLNLNEFSEITAKDDVAERSLVVISIAGAMRKGKSLLLNFFLTHAYKTYRTTKTIARPKTFEKGSLIDGFSHCGGTERHTTGIQVWPDIFLHDYPDGKKIALIFMDTQGTFDYETNFSDCVAIFALSTLLSSVQIYNISYNIQNDHLQYLALFVEYAKLALGKISPTTESTSPFNDLQILVRDWNFPYQAEYGLAGGKTIIDKIFSSSKAEISRTASTIKDGFKNIDCFLMPYPGSVIATTPRFDGNIENVDEIFLEMVKVLVAHLLDPHNLKCKTINGEEIKMGNFPKLIKQGFEVLSKYENIPKPKTIVAATAESQNYKIIANAVEIYKQGMVKHLSRYVENDEFRRLHDKYFKKSMCFYQMADKLETFDAEMDQKWQIHLTDLLMRESNFYLLLNEKRMPDTSEALQNLIQAVTDQQDVVKQLNEQHAQNMLDLINTFREREEQHREEMKELTRKFQQSPESGFNFMDLLTKIVDIVPSVIQTLGLQNTGIGRAAMFGMTAATSLLSITR